MPIFVSYSRQDFSAVKPIVDYLAAQGYEYWWDQQILAGDAWDTTIESRISSCTTFLLFSSQSAMASRNVRDEIDFARTLNKNIIVARLEGTGAGLLAPLAQSIDFSRDRRSALSELTFALLQINESGSLRSFNASRNHPLQQDIVSEDTLTSQVPAIQNGAPQRFRSLASSAWRLIAALVCFFIGVVCIGVIRSESASIPVKFFLIIMGVAILLFGVYIVISSYERFMTAIRSSKAT